MRDLVSQFQPPSQPGQSGPDQRYPQWPQQPLPYPQPQGNGYQQQQSYPPQQSSPQWQTPSRPSQQPPEGTWQPPLQPLPPPPYPQQYPPQMQQPGMYPPAQPIMVMPQQIVNVNIQQKQHGLFMRALYFIFIGWWAGLFWLNMGYFFVLTVIGLPVGLLMLNRLPTVLTLKPASQQVNINITGGVTNINIGGAQQVSFLIRAVYFVFIGWWAGLLLAWVAYALFVLVVTIPLGVMLLNLLPTVITLRKN